MEKMEREEIGTPQMERCLLVRERAGNVPLAAGNTGRKNVVVMMIQKRKKKVEGLDLDHPHPCDPSGNGIYSFRRGSKILPRHCVHPENQSTTFSVHD